MGIYSPRHSINCTTKNALLGGMCTSHFSCAFNEDEDLTSRIIHLVLGLLEAIPIAGQAISFVELSLVRNYLSPQRHEPKSCIPLVKTFKKQNHESVICCKWPTDLKLLMITSDQRKEIDNTLNEAFIALEKGGSYSFNKKKLSYSYSNNTIEVNLPIAVHIEKDNSEGTYRIYLLTKKVFAAGGERKIRLVYELTQGIFFVKKKIVGKAEETIINGISPLRHLKGIENQLVWRSSQDKFDNKKLEFIEPIRDGTLPMLFKSIPLANFQQKITIIKDLIAELDFLHSLESTVSFEIKSYLAGNTSIVSYPYRGYHADLSLANILVSEQSGVWRAELCDFGRGAANPSVITYSCGYTPPEYVKYIEESKYISKDSIDFNIKYGQKKDIWSLGLIIISLLLEKEVIVQWYNAFDGKAKCAKIPPLPCLKSIFTETIYSLNDENGILKLTQKTLDDDIASIEKEVTSKNPTDIIAVKEVFKLVKMMLKVHPDERCTIDNCLSYLL